MSVRFEAAPPLPRWLEREMPFRRRMAVVEGTRIHLVDEGDGVPALLMHGNPTWSFLWRKVIPHLTARGVRAIAPDLMGLGLSDKPLRPRDHQLAHHIDSIARVVDALGLERFVVVGQDWGGPIAAGVAKRFSERVAGVVFANTAVIRPARPFRPKAFHRFSNVPLISDLVFRGLGFPLQVLDRAQGERSSIGRFEKRAYAWPLRRPWNRAAPIGLARMIPTHEGHPTTAVMDEIGAWVESFRGPAALVWGTRDPILGRALRRHRAALPQATVTETDAGHFLQEEVPAELADAVISVACAPARVEARD